MTWREFEKLMGEAFRQRGYQVLEAGGQGADGGVDLTLRKGNETFLVQCKHWKAYKVSVQTVRELYGVMAAAGAAGGFLVTSGRFTQEAVAFASGRNIQLVDGPQLHAWLRQAEAPIASTAAQSLAQNPPPATNGHARTPACPMCDKPMVRRTAKRGTNAGRGFWGCPSYPACKGTRSD